MRFLLLFLGLLAAWLLCCRWLLHHVGAKPVCIGCSLVCAVLVTLSMVAAHTAYSIRLALPFYALVTDVMGIAPTDRVEDRLFIGNIHAASEAATLQQLGITHVLAVSQYGEQARFHPSLFRYHVITAHDYVSSSLLPHLHTAADFIHAALEGGGTVYVHCNVGRSRSATCLAAYFVKYRGLTPTDAIIHLQRKRAVCPNAGFRQQLDRFHAAMHANATASASASAGQCLPPSPT
eukprot:GGOE01036379.1.p1 GENE.GGOE01036379.1~~GGOE01036379.1.p1  ORF type:complete len:235 (-),score=40.85 GGOE01036379.1:239-943(-)